jgi:hypothetical protein
MAYDYIDAGINVPFDPTFVAVEDVLGKLEYAYNLFAWPYSEHFLMLEDRPFWDDLRQDLEVKKTVSSPGDFINRYAHIRYGGPPLRGQFHYSRGPEVTYLANRATRLLMNDSALELRLLGLSPSASFVVKFRGLGTAIKHILHAIDPNYRREQAEAVRHLTAVNKMKEKELHRIDQIADVDGVIQIHRRLLDAQIITPEEYRESIRACVFLQGTAVESLTISQLIPLSLTRGEDQEDESGDIEIIGDFETPPELPPPSTPASS